MDTKQEQDSWPRKEEATNYLEKHKICELFNNLTSQLIYHKPSQPKEFLVEQLEALLKARSSRLGYPCLFDEENLRSVFGMLDPTGQGYITAAQYEEAMKSLGIKNYDPKPNGAELDKVTMDTFVRLGKLGLSKSSATFK